ncbi:SlyX family protein [Magnetospirillum sp. UT-4]|uniref:SlyX family protein n=1 Tax=Magnetospirillum sp. UT-4 TaxID=2681467 RepID=UPI00138092CC|nr:SlyX family protein [Magnetospirillum sp. UT-4]CAA7623369.1 conserved hypothetical protein [Magnetospirillum sp. UT-4]
MNADSDRLTAVETALAHAEAAIHDLSDMVRSQGREIDALRGEVTRLRAALIALRDRDEDGEGAFVP